MRFGVSSTISLPIFHPRPALESLARVWFGLLAGLALLLGAARAAAEAADSGPLTPDAVLAASSEHFPAILESLARRRAALGEVTAAEGEFDIVFGADGFGRATGFYDGTAVGATATQPLMTNGGRLFAGYDLSRGDFPIYEDEYFTNEAGKVKAGVVLALLRDRHIDERRFGIRDARLGARQADLDLLLTRIGVQQRALVAYWRWVARGQQLGVYEELLRNAAMRENALSQQVQRGAQAQIFLTENRQNVIRRMSLVTAARRDFQIAANELGFYYRNESGEPVVPDARRLPPAPSAEALMDLAVTEAVRIPEAVERRPELQLLRTGIQRMRQRLALHENELKPRFDVSLEVQHGLGAVGEGGPSRDSTDTILGFSFSVPLQQRTARGKIAETRAELEAAMQEQRTLEDRIELELRNILLDLNFAQALVQLAAEEVGQAEVLQRAEQRRFESGASDFFLVNVREETAADARVRFFAAALDTRIARANYDAATVDLERLGLDPATSDRR